MTHADPLLDVRDIRVHFPAKPDPVKAVDGVSFTVSPGETVGLVGESGSGKTTIGKALIKLVAPTSGQILYRGRDVMPLREREFRPLRKEMQMIFQDPFSSLNPRWTIGGIIAEPLEIHFPHLNKSERMERVASLLRKVALPADAMRRYPHEFSGGQRPRAGCGAGIHRLRRARQCPRRLRAGANRQSAAGSTGRVGTGLFVHQS